MRRVAHPVPALVPKWSKIKPKTFKIKPRWGPKMGYPIGPVSEKIERKHQRNKEEGSTSQGPPPGAEKGANMAQT